MLPLIFAGLLAFIIMMYVILDGFDLGIGILFPFTHTEEERDQMMNSVAPIWDGNETWLVFGGAMLYGAFPAVYGQILPLLYMPIMMMLIALIFRGVSFEFRFKANRSKSIWNWSFAIGSITAAFFQGIILGCFIESLNPDKPVMLNHIDWLTPFSLMTAIALVCGYGLLGATWTVIKSEGDLQKKMSHYAQGLLILIGFFLVIVSIWTPAHNPAIFQRWYSVPNILYLAPLPLITTLMMVLTWHNLSKVSLAHATPPTTSIHGFESPSSALYLSQAKRHEKKPFIYSIAIFICSYLGIGISCFPYMIPNQLTIWQGAAPDSTLRFILVGVAVMLPILFAYTLYAYHVFRGKTKNGYH